MSDATTPPSQSVSPWYTDKALYLTVLSVLLPFVSKLVGFQLDPEKVAMFLVPVVAYIVAHKWKAGTVLVAEIEAKAKAQLAAQPPVTDAKSAAAAVNAL